MRSLRGGSFEDREGKGRGLNGERRKMLERGGEGKNRCDTFDSFREGKERKVEQFLKNETE